MTRSVNDPQVEAELTLIVERYLASGDFNGLALTPGDLNSARAEHLAHLIRVGEVELVGADDFINL